MKKFILFTFLVFGFSFLSPELNAQVVVDTSCYTVGHTTWYGFKCNGSGDTTCYVACPEVSK